VALAALGVLMAAAAVGVLLMLVSTERPEPFSSFVPKDEDPVKRAQEVADHVSARYLAESGVPLVTVTAAEDDKSALPGADQAVAVQTSPPGFFSFEYGNILFFRMCATGDQCAIPKDVAPGTLAPILAQEARELALYGLKYVKEATFVMVVLPPGFVGSPNPAEPVTAIHFYRRSDLDDALDKPVADTLPGEPPTPGTLTQSQAESIEGRERTTRYTLTSGPDASNTSNVYTITPLF
jgi:hypothetical protein